MSHALDYLKRVLTPAEYATYREKAAIDSKDSYARQKWRISQNPHNGKASARARAWLLARGYVDEAGNWTGLTWKEERHGNP